MFKFNKVLLALIVISFTIPSCSKLELSPTSEISNASFWKNPDDVNGGLIAMYALLRNQTDNLYIWGESRSEILGRSVAGRAGMYYYYGNGLDAQTLTWTEILGDISWMGMYGVIHHANLIIKNVPNIQFPSEAAKNHALAQAYTMRAYCYFVMTRTWGDLIINTEPTGEVSSPETALKERKPKEEVMALIKSDLATAIGLFSDYSFPTGRHKWSKAAALALKGDVYLWSAKRMGGGTADIQTALDALEEVDNAEVELLESFPSVFAYDNKGNKEILMAIRLQDGENTGSIHSNMGIGGLHMPTNVDQETKDLVGALGGTPVMAPTELVRNQFSTDDQRRDGTFIEIYTIDGDGNRTFYGSIGNKFKGLVVGGQKRHIDDIVLYRYADVLLMKAEAKNALGQDPSVEMNLIRERAYGDNYTDHVFVNGSQAENDAAILKERLLELMLEGKRWWDLIRFGKVFELVPSLFDRVGQEHLLLFPISEQTLAAERLVEQNPGY